MKDFKLPLVILLVLAFSLTAFSQLRYKGTVVEIVDGKTVVIEVSPAKNRLTAELQAIEVPEPEQELHGVVKDHLKKLLLGKQVEFDAWQLKSPRTIGQIFAGGIDISQQMLRDGAAWYAINDKGRRSSAVQEQNYRNAEAQAKQEKRGVWSIATLKPAWEFRAEKEKINKPQPVADAVRENTVKDEQPVLTTRARNFLRQQEAIGNDTTPDYGAGMMWSDVDAYAAAGESKNSAGLLTKYESAYNIGYTSTPILDLSVQADKNLRKALFRVGYFYKGSILPPGQGLYLIGIWSESKDWAFLQSNNLTVIADGRAINIGKAHRFFRKDDSSVQELLIYRVGFNTLQKISDAKTVSFKFGNYSSPVESKSQNTINTLLTVSQ